MGRSLLPLLNGEAKNLDLISFAEGDFCYSANYRNWKIMLVDSTGAVNLYDLSRDPRETTNVASDSLRAFGEMNRYLSDYIKSVEQIEQAADTELDPETIKQLRALGYL